MQLTTAGESHGPGLTAILAGLPMGLRLSAAAIDRELVRRQEGAGRGERMAIERDRVRITGGLRRGRTLGGPLCLHVDNRDYANWERSMSPLPRRGPAPAPVTLPRPGHADLAGVLKTGAGDIRAISERASARETAARVAAGAACKVLLAELGVTVFSHVLAIGGVTAQPEYGDLAVLAAAAAGNDLHVADPEAERRMRRTIKSVCGDGDTLGGIAEVVATGLPPGLGHYAAWEQRLDGRLAQAALSIPGVKGVEIGDAFAGARMRGSRVHDEILPNPRAGRAGELRTRRPSNRAGGLEGGMTNGQPLLLRAAMKPIASLTRPLRSVDLATGRPARAARERGDCVAVPAMGVVLEAMTALVLADAVLEQFGADTLRDLKAAWRRYRNRQAKQ
ncbi:MAG: chorismate synthase [Candidatus Krumholzibacteriota bacterium]|nr:chorismate synthase [Candidatus Krumholzibacteriota bacterium]